MELRMSRKERDRLSEGLCEKVVAALTSAWCFFGTRWSTLRILWAMHRWRVAGVKTRECPSRREPTGPKNLTYAEGFESENAEMLRAIERVSQATGRSKIEKTLQVPEVQELVACLSDVAERPGFEPGVPLRVHTVSNRAQSAALAPLRAGTSAVETVARIPPGCWRVKAGG